MAGAAVAPTAVVTGGSEVTTISAAIGSSRICPAKILSGSVIWFFSMIAWIGRPKAAAILPSVSPCWIL